MLKAVQRGDLDWRYLVNPPDGNDDAEGSSMDF